MNVQLSFKQYPELESPHKFDYIWDKIIEIYNDPNNSHPNIYAASSIQLNKYITELSMEMHLEEIVQFTSKKTYDKYLIDKNVEFTIALYKAGFIDAQIAN